MKTSLLESRSIRFSLEHGFSPDAKPIQRKLSAMKGMYADDQAQAELIRQKDPVVYEFYDLKQPETSGNISFGTSIVHPGRVGDEYFMTKGHFHTILDTGEVYYCLKGRGLMLMENPEGVWETRELTPGTAVHVPPRFAHRSINTSGSESMVTFFAFRSDAGHDYGSIETKGFRKLVVDRNGKPEIIDNPRWKLPA